MLNWTVESIIIILSGLPIFIGVLLLFRQYRIHEDKIFQLLTISWALQAIYLVVFGIAYLFLEPILIRLNSIILAINLFLLITVYDHMNNLSIDPRKTTFAGILSSFLIFTAFFENAVTPSVFLNGDKSYDVAGYYRITTSIVAFTMAIIYIYYALKIVNNVPQNLRKWAELNLLGVILFSLVVIILFAFGITTILPGSATIVSAIGAMISIFAFVRSPQLIYILPFKAYKLLVIDSNSGTTLYSYNWSEMIGEETKFQLSNDLIASALSGLNLFATEAIQMGGIQEMKLDKAVLYLNPVPEKHLQFVLISSKPSRVLKNNMRTFSNLFIQKLIAKDFNRSYSDITSFKLADDLIEIAFPYIATYN